MLKKWKILLVLSALFLITTVSCTKESKPVLLKSADYHPNLDHIEKEEHEEQSLKTKGNSKRYKPMSDKIKDLALKNLLDDPEQLSAGKKIFALRACVGCHSLDGRRMTGPTFKGLWGQVKTFPDGTTQKVDFLFISESIQYPDNVIGVGYPARNMPAYLGILTESDIISLAAFIKSLQK